MKRCHMKLIEKLAHDWWLKNRNEVFDQESAYEAGFRKAREMSQEHSNECCGCPGYETLGEEEV